MDYIQGFIDWFSGAFQSMVDFIDYIPDMFTEILSYLQLWYVKFKIASQIQFLTISYHTAELLLEDLGFQTLLVTAFNSLPDEVRYYAYAFGIPKGLSVIVNCFTTAFVMRMSR